jgi:hypothetical protein
VIRARTLILTVACALAAVAAVSAPAHAKVSATSTVSTKNGATKLVVTIVESGRFTDRARPRGVTARLGRRTLVLRRGGAAVARSVWSTRAYRGATAAALQRLVGKRVPVTVRTRAGTRTFRPSVAPATAIGGGGGAVGGGGATPPPNRPAEVGGEEGRRQFHEALIGRRLRWQNRPSGYDAAETWGFCPDVVYQRYVSSTLPTDAWQTQSYGYTVTAGFVHPAALPQAELLGQIVLNDSSATRYNIAFAYGRQTGAWAKAGSSTDYPFTVSGYTCGEELPS